MISRHSSTSPLGNRSVSPRFRSAAQFPAERRSQENEANDGVIESFEESNVPFSCSTEYSDPADWVEGSSSGNIPPELSRTEDAPENIERPGSVSPDPDNINATFSAPNQDNFITEGTQPEAGFSSYFANDSSLSQQDDPMFSYDYNAQYLAEIGQQNMSSHGRDHSLLSQDSHASPIQYDQIYSDVSHYFEDGNQQIEESQLNQNDYEGYYEQQTEVYSQGTPFITSSQPDDGTNYWNPADYPQESQYYDNQSGYFDVPNSSSYHQEIGNDHLHTADQDFYNNQHELTADNHHQYFEHVAFNDVDLNAPDAGSNPQYHPAPRPRSKNPYRPPDPHPLITFAFGGKVGFSLIRTRTRSQHHSLSQDVEIKLHPGKLRVCSTGFLLKETRLARLVSEYPGPISSSTNISAVCRKLSTTNNELLWKLIDILASNKGSWNIDKVTELLTSSGSESDNGTWLGSGKIPSANSGSAQPVQATEDDLLHIQGLVTTGKHVEAAEFAASRALWSHALIISMNCDDRVRLYLIQRYRDSFLLPGSQLYTVYSALAECPIQSTESWKRNLAALLNIKKNGVAIFQLGELLLSENNVVAAHACFLLSGRLDKLSLIALPGPTFKFFQCPYPESVQLTECFEQSVRQKDSGFTMEALVYSRFCYACLLIDLGHNDTALRYVRNVLRSITDSSKNKKQSISGRFSYAVRLVDHQLSQIASSDSGSESSGVLGSIFNNLSKLLIGKEEQDVSKPAPQPTLSQSSIPRSSAAPEQASDTEPNAKPSDNESVRNANIISKITGLFRSRNTSSQGDLADFEEEEKFEWDPVTKKWISNLTGPAQPPPPPVESAAPVRRPPPRPNVSVSHLPRASLSKTQITTRYALQDRSESSSSYPQPPTNPQS